MLEVYNCIKVGLKFKLLDIIEHIKDDNFEICRLVLNNIVISHADSDQLNSEYKEIFIETTTHWIKIKVLEFCRRHEDIYGILQVGKPLYESLAARGENIQPISLEKLNDAFVNEPLLVEGYTIDCAALPPHERIISHYMEIVE